VALPLIRSIVQVVPEVDVQPAHPPNTELPVGVAVSVTIEPGGNAPLHEVAVLEQPSPPGELPTMPVPVPENWTVNVFPVPVKQVTSVVI